MGAPCIASDLVLPCSPWAAFSLSPCSSARAPSCSPPRPSPPRRQPRARRRRQSPTPSPSPSPTPSPDAIAVADTLARRPVAVCPMNGQQARRTRASATRTPILVQIENNPIARPPSGLNLRRPRDRGAGRGRHDALRRGLHVQPGRRRGGRAGALGALLQRRPVAADAGAHVPLRRRASRCSTASRPNGMPYVNGLSMPWAFFFRAGSWGAPHDVFFDVDAGTGEHGVGRPLQAESPAGRSCPRAVHVRRRAGASRRAAPVNSIGLTTASFWHFGWEWDRGVGLPGCASTAERRTSTPSPATGSARGR